MMAPIVIPGTFCLNCVQQVKMKVYPFPDAPVLACGLCRWRVTGRWDGTEAVFPDPHVGKEES